jgi:spore maturation protein CgeB
MDTLPHYDLHVTQRDVSLQEYLRRGARDVMKVQTAYEPTIHFPPPEGWSDSDRNRDVSFIGSPYDERAAQLTSLWREHQVPMVISGNERSWRKALDEEAFAGMYREGEIFQQLYREAIWRSKINLSFLTHSNQDEYTHKSFEIAACGGFLLAERSQGHTERFVEGVEAEFFADMDEMLSKIHRYLGDEPARAKIAAAGQRRAANSGYSNDAQVERVLERMRSKLPQLATEVRG